MTLRMSGCFSIRLRGKDIEWVDRFSVRRKRRTSHEENEKEEKVAEREWEGTLGVKFKCRRTDRSSAQLRVRENTFLDTSKGLACN